VKILIDGILVEDIASISVFFHGEIYPLRAFFPASCGEQKIPIAQLRTSGLRMTLIFPPGKGKHTRIQGCSISGGLQTEKIPEKYNFPREERLSQTVEVGSPFSRICMRLLTSSL
jgi:hypothetical protein